jgi:hypothetical protein
VKCPDGVTGWQDGAPGCPDGDSGCSDDTVVSSGHPYSLSRRACFYDLLRGTTSGHHLSSVRTANPVGLNHILPGAARHFLFSLFSFVLFVVLWFFLVIFMCISHVHMYSLQFISSPGMFVYLFTVLF